jgi:hypothetical protein
MFGLFGPRPPIGTWDKAWVEWRLRWLADRFGIDRLRNARVVVPTEEFSPTEALNDPAAVREWLDRICRQMGVNPDTLALEVRPDRDAPEADGRHPIGDRSRIVIAESQVATPSDLLATLAQEVAHKLLLQNGFDLTDAALVADLLAVYLGGGLLLVNSPLRAATGSSGGGHPWSVAKPGRLTGITASYALAVCAFVRGEDRPPWAAHLRTDAAVTLKAGRA